MIRLFLVAVLLLLGLAPASASAQADDLVQQLVRQRRDARFAEILAELGDRVPLRAPDTLDVGLLDDPGILRYWWSAEAARRAAAVPPPRTAPYLDQIAWSKIEPDDQGAFLDQYGETYWTVRGLTAFARIDTTATPVLRGRLASIFGTPTRNAAAREQEGYAGSMHVQFEYWFVVNDSIPLLAMDVNGPFGRGLILAGAERDTLYLPEVKAHLDGLLAEAGPTAYVDYFLPEDETQWYRTGYDGDGFFVRETRRPRWARRRPGQRWVIHR